MLNGTTAQNQHRCRGPLSKFKFHHINHKSKYDTCYVFQTVFLTFNLYLSKTNKKNTNHINFLSIKRFCVCSYLCTMCFASVQYYWSYSNMILEVGIFFIRLSLRQSHCMYKPKQVSPAVIYNN